VLRLRSEIILKGLDWRGQERIGREWSGVEWKGKVN